MFYFFYTARSDSQVSLLALGASSKVAGRNRGASGRGALLQLPLQPLALDRDLSEGLSEEVLRPVTASVPTVAANRDDHALVLAVVREHAFEAVGQAHEVFVFSDLSFKQPRLNLQLLEVDDCRHWLSNQSWVALDVITN